MSIADILFTAGGGGVVGTLLHFGTSWIEHKQKLEEMRVTAELAEKTEAWKAFTAAQSADQGLDALPANVWPWVASLYALVEGFRRLTRPGLTWASGGLLIWASYNTHVTPSQWDSISFGFWTAFFFWFGSRYSRNK